MQDIRNGRAIILSLQKGHLLDFYVLCVAFAAAAIPIGGYYLKYDWLGLIVISFFALLAFIQKGALERNSLRYVFLATAYLELNGLLSASFGASSFLPRSFWSYFFQYVLAFVGFVAIVNFRLSANSVFGAMRWWVMIACAASALAIMQALSGRIIVDSILFIPYYENATISSKFVGGILASTAWFSEASWMGSFLVVPIIFVAFQLSSEQVVRAQYLRRIAVFGLLLTGLFLGYSLTAIIAVFVGLFVIALVFPRSRLIFGIVVLAAIGTILFFDDTPRVALQIRRFSELWEGLLNFTPGSQAYGTATSLYVRSIGFGKGLSDFAQHPIFGVGLGQGTVVYDSGLITLLAEQGAVGFAIYYGLPFYAIMNLIKLRKSNARDVSLLATFLLVGLIADYTNGFVTHNPFHSQRWLLISIACSWIWALKRNQSEGRKSSSRSSVQTRAA